MKKETIVLLPGYDGEGVKTFRELKLLIENKYNVIAIDYPYYNNPKKQYNLNELVEFVNNKFDGKAVILGFSMGGFIGSKFASKYPNKVSKLVLLCSNTQPILDIKSKLMVFVLNILFRSRKIALSLTNYFMTHDVKYVPLPKLNSKFDRNLGYVVAGTLGKILTQTKKLDFAGEKLALLFEDDKIFSAKIYKPVLIKQGFDVKNFKTGGHAEGVDYWEKVAKSL